MNKMTGLTRLSGGGRGLELRATRSVSIVQFVHQLLIRGDQVFLDVNGGVIQVLLLELCNLSPQLGVFPAESIVLILLCRVSPLVTGDMGKGIIHILKFKYSKMISNFDFPFAINQVQV